MEITKKMILETVINIVEREVITLNYTSKIEGMLAVEKVLKNIVNYKENLEKNNKI